MSLRAMTLCWSRWSPQRMCSFLSESDVAFRSTCTLFSYYYKNCVCSHGFRHRVLPARWAVLPTPVPYPGLSHPGPPYSRSQAGSPHHVQGHCGKNSKMGSERKTGRPLGGGGLSQDVQGLKEQDEEPGQLRSQWRAIGGPKASLQRFIWKQYGGRMQGQRIK